MINPLKAVTKGLGTLMRKRSYSGTMVERDQLAIDVEGLKVIDSYHARNRLEGNIWDLPLIARSVGMGLGAASEDDYQVVQA